MDPYVNLHNSRVYPNCISMQFYISGKSIHSLAYKLHLQQTKATKRSRQLVRCRCRRFFYHSDTLETSFMFQFSSARLANTIHPLSTERVVRRYRVWSRKVAICISKLILFKCLIETAAEIWRGGRLMRQTGSSSLNFVQFALLIIIHTFIWTVKYRKFVK